MPVAWVSVEVFDFEGGSRSWNLLIVGIGIHCGAVFEPELGAGVGHIDGKWGCGVGVERKGMGSPCSDHLQSSGAISTVF